MLRDENAVVRPYDSQRAFSSFNVCKNTIFGSALDETRKRNDQIDRQIVSNKTNLVVTWPTNVFSIEELNNANPEFVNITLRVRLKKAIDNGQVGEVGYLHNGKGRPRVVLACTPITDQHIIEAKNRGCNYQGWTKHQCNQD